MIKILDNYDSYIRKYSITVDGILKSVICNDYIVVYISNTEDEYLKYFTFIMNDIEQKFYFLISKEMRLHAE